MSVRPVHAIAGRTLRHWTIDSRELGAGSQRPAPALPYSEQPRAGQFHLLASKLARIALRISSANVADGSASPRFDGGSSR